MIERIHIHFPETVVSNEELAALYPGWTPEKIFEKTGIRSRHVARPDECVSDLALAAARGLLGRVDGAEVDFLLLCTQTADYLLPTTACLIQDRLGLPTTVGAVDFNLGCSGYIYGLAISQSLIRDGIAKSVLLLTADTYSRLIHPGDKSTRTIFGDAATATLMRAGSPRRLHSFVLRTDGRGFDQLIVKTGGAKHRKMEQTQSVETDASGNVRDPNCLFMNGPEVFSFTVRVVPQMVEEILAKAGLTLDAIDLFVFHQANAYMLEHLRRKLKIPRERFEICLEHCGNTVSSTIPIALDSALAAGRMKPGMKILLAGFGVGLSWGGCILEWNE